MNAACDRSWSGQFPAQSPAAAGPLQRSHSQLDAARPFGHARPAEASLIEALLTGGSDTQPAKNGWPEPGASAKQRPRSVPKSIGAGGAEGQASVLAHSPGVCRGRPCDRVWGCSGVVPRARPSRLGGH